MRRNHHLGRAAEVRATASAMGRRAAAAGCRGVSGKAAAIEEGGGSYVLSGSIDELELQARKGRVGGGRLAEVV